MTVLLTLLHSRQPRQTAQLRDPILRSHEGRLCHACRSNGIPDVFMTVLLTLLHSRLDSRAKRLNFEIPSFVHTKEGHLCHACRSSGIPDVFMTVLLTLLHSRHPRQTAQLRDPILRSHEGRTPVSCMQIHRRYESFCRFRASTSSRKHQTFSCEEIPRGIVVSTSNRKVSTSVELVVLKKTHT